VGSVASGVRFLTGIGMVAAGVALAVPAGQLTVDAWLAAQQPGAAGGGAMVAPAAAPHAPPASGSRAEPGQWLTPPDALPPPVELRADYSPPPRPDQLPPVSAAALAEAPGMNGTYRSTLQVPPPPLLDAQAPPPATVAWTVPTPAAAVVGQSPVAAEPAPSTYVIRDGDDLAAISARFYGHPGAAPALWAANRDLIPNPDLLPIGGQIRLPPPWAVPGVAAMQQAGVRSIEPPPTAVAPRQIEAVPASATWLDGRQPLAPSVPAARPTTTVRLAPGETLETLAERFYGDRRAAARIWEANRDRLRSPELAVPGIELRLP
jgi:nucleoid-associated protein YgaU